MRQVGRPKTDKPYRQNIVRVARIEDILERILEEIPSRSVAKDIIKRELAELRLEETRKLVSKVIK